MNENQICNYFDSIAKTYDLTNTIVSFGLHHYWRKFAMEQTGLLKGSLVLDVCCGTGMMMVDLVGRVGPEGKVFGLDFSENMLRIAKDRFKSLKHGNCEFIPGNAMDLPFPDHYFDCATIAFGLRNVPDRKKALLEIKRVLKPGAKMVSLELVKPIKPLFLQIYNFYLSNWIPLIGKIVTGNGEAFQYLHQSIIHYPQPEEVTRLLENLGFKDPRCYKLSWGIAAVHIGTKAD